MKIGELLLQGFLILIIGLAGYAIVDSIQTQVINERTKAVLYVEPYRDERGHSRTGWCYNGWEYKQCVRQ